MSSQDFPDLTPKRTRDNPYPRSLSASEPLKFYAAEKELEILILNAKMNQNMVSSKQFQQVLKELKQVSEDPQLAGSVKLAFDRLIAQFMQAGIPEGNKVKIDLEKMQALLNVLQRS